MIINAARLAFALKRMSHVVDKKNPLKEYMSRIVMRPLLPETNGKAARVEFSATDGVMLARWREPAMLGSESRWSTKAIGVTKELLPSLVTLLTTRKDLEACVNFRTGAVLAVGGSDPDLELGRVILPTETEFLTEHPFDSEGALGRYDLLPKKHRLHNGRAIKLLDSAVVQKALKVLPPGNCQWEFGTEYPCWIQHLEQDVMVCLMALNEAVILGPGEPFREIGR